MVILFAIGIVGAFVFLVLYGINILYEYCVEYLSDIYYLDSSVKIKFNNFYDWYNINSKRWILEDNYVKIETGRTSRFGYTTEHYKICYFSFRDWKKYKKFKKNLKKKNKAKSYNETMIKILEAVQQDIDALRNQSNQEIKEASDRAVEIAERLKEQ